MSHDRTMKADEIVDKIRRKNGGVTDEEKRTWHPDALEMISNLRRQLAASTRTLATNLYSSDARFLYELVQNAEDNSYSHAKAKGEAPYLQFSIWPDQMQIDSNEDGFIEAHVKAICSIGESSKKDVKGYVGEKGIGFKSVFKVAKKVHIQSATYSFSFTYATVEDEDGLGMVTPYNAPRKELPDSVRTRFTLTPRDDSSFDQRVNDLEALPDTFLLFLTRLRTIGFSVHRTGTAAVRTQYSIDTESSSENECFISKTVTIGNQVTTTKKKFYVFRRTTNDLPDDPSRPGNNSAEVVLAFPVTMDDVPLLHDEYTYAYLPLRKVGFKFLIQSDFITQASREDVFDSERNVALLKVTAQTFRDAVLHFCQMKRLRYTWVRFLPWSSIADSFWKKLYPLIEKLLKPERIVLSRQGCLYRARDLRRIPDMYLDEHGEPLMQDLNPEIYLADLYSTVPGALAALSCIGVTDLSEHEFLERLSADLKRDNSRYKSTTQTNDWHARLVQVLVTKTPMSRFRCMSLIPLRNGNWTTALATTYYPQCGGIDVPSDLNLNLLDPDALTSQRNPLWSMMGVKNVTETLVLDQVVDAHRQVGSRTLNDYVAHMKFVYWHVDWAKKPNLLTSGKLMIVDTTSTLRRLQDPPLAHLYYPQAQSLFRSSPYVASSLLPMPENGEDLGYRFLNSAYVRGDIGSRHGRTWADFLEHGLGVTYHPRLLEPSNKGLSREFEYIIKSKSKDLVPVLWKHQNLYSIDFGKVKKTLAQALVPTDDGRHCQLRRSVFPSPEIREWLTEIDVLDFPFLTVSEKLVKRKSPTWNFLTKFEVVISEGLDLFLRVLDFLSSKSWESEVEGVPLSIAHTYARLENSCGAKDALSKLRNRFSSQSSIYIPGGNAGAGAPTWSCIEDCVWSGPEWLTIKHCLKRCPDYHSLEHFFARSLGLRNMSWEDAIQELQTMQKRDSLSKEDAEKVTLIYSYLWREFKNDSSGAVLRERFNELDLIYVPSVNGWCKPSKCVWAESKLDFPDLVSIASDFPTLTELFQNILKVQTPDLSMHVSALAQLGGLVNKSSAQVKASITLISSLNPTETDLESLSRSKIFRVLTGRGKASFTDRHSHFFIVDRLRYGEAFKGKLHLLDFTLEEVRAADKFLKAMGLGNMYLSTAVEEETRCMNDNRSNGLTSDFQSKAFALCRIAVHFDSVEAGNEPSKLMRRLQTSVVSTSSHITKVLRVIQNGKERTVEGEKANFHLRASDANLSIHVPKHRGDRDICYLQAMPHGLTKFLGIREVAAEKVILSILSARSVYAMKGILSDSGIIDVSGIEAPEEEDELSDNDSDPSLHATPIHQRVDSSIATPPRATNTGLLTPQTATPPNKVASAVPPSIFDFTSQAPRAGLFGPFNPRPATPPTRAGSAVPSSLFTFTPPSNGPSASVNLFANPAGEATNPSPRISAPSPRLSPGLFNLPIREVPTATADDDGYGRILDRLVRAARGSEVVVPPAGLHHVWNTDYDGNTTFDSLFPYRNFDRDCRVGAAGELFVFELLKSWGLSHFNTANWQSNMRKLVRVHPDYSDLRPWEGRETSDIVYDTLLATKLRELLEAAGHRFPESFTGPSFSKRYLIEVKTTTGRCEEPFYMSNAQYNRMRFCSRDSPGTVYVLFRVFKVDKASVGLSIFVDPEAARERGELDFTADTWSVRVA